MATKQKQLPDALLAEVWAVMHLAVASDVSGLIQNEHMTYDCKASHDSDFIAEGEVSSEMESDSPLDGNCNEDHVDDLQALKDAAEKLAIIGDSYSQSKEEENNLIDEIVKCLDSKAKKIDAKLEKELCTSMPSSDIFQEPMVNVVYGEVKTKLETFLVGNEGLDKIAMVTHITKGVSSALRNVSAPAVSLAAAISYRFVTEKYADIILQGGGLPLKLQELQKPLKRNEVSRKVPEIKRIKNFAVMRTRT